MSDIKIKYLNFYLKSFALNKTLIQYLAVIAQSVDLFLFT